MQEPTDTGITPRDQRNSSRYIRYTALWALVYGACTYVLGAEYVEPGMLRWLIAFVPSAFAVLSARAYWRYLNEMDELLRAIELRALALAISVGFVAWPAVQLLEIGVPLDIHLPVTLLLMTASYTYGLARGRMEHLV